MTIVLCVCVCRGGGKGGGSGGGDSSDEGDGEDNSMKKQLDSKTYKLYGEALPQECITSQYITCV